PGAVDSGRRLGPERPCTARDGAGTAGFRGAGAVASCCPDPAAAGRGPGSCTGGDPGSPGGNTRASPDVVLRSEEHTSELQSRENLVCRLLLEKKKKMMMDA